MGTNYIFANSGQLIRLVVQTLDSNGYRTDGYIPVVESVILPDLSLDDGYHATIDDGYYPQPMSNYDTGLYYHNMQLPTGITSLGNYIANVYWEENGLPKWEIFVINVARPFGNTSVSPI